MHFVTYMDSEPTCKYTVNMLYYLYFHYENLPIQIYKKFHLQKLKNIQIKNSDIFHISAQNIDCEARRF